MVTENKAAGADTSERRPDLDEKLPVRVDRREGAAIISQKYFRCSHRTIEVWPVLWTYVNGRATCETAELLDLAKAKLEAAPRIRGGKSRAALNTIRPGVVRPSNQN